MNAYFKAGPQVNWAYWTHDEIINTNQEHQRTNFGAVDCDLNKNIIYFDYKNINFGQDYVYEYTEDSEAREFVIQLAEVKKRCPDVRVVFDSQLEWTAELAEQIIQKKVSISQLVKSITDFHVKYYTDGLGRI